MKLSSLVVTYNDANHLERCLASLLRFDELIVVDLGSSDRSVEIAKSMGITVHQHTWSPAIELILPDLIKLTQNAWIIRIDPDEVLPPILANELLTLEINDGYGMVTFPLQYYFLNRKLDTTAWGGIRYATRIFHKERTFMEDAVHGKHLCKEDYRTYQIDFSGANAVAHYWIDSLPQLFSKHERYLKLEGESRYGKGMSYSWIRLVKHTLIHFIFSFIKRSGWRGGWAGWFLSFFYAHYELRAWLALRDFEKQLLQTQQKLS